MPDKPTKADLIRSHIKESLANDIDSLRTVDGRKPDFVKLQTNNPETTFTKSHYLDILKQEIKRAGNDPRTFNLSVRTPSFVKRGGSIGGTTTPQPKKIINSNTPYSKDSATNTPPNQPQIAGQPSEATQQQIQQLSQQIQFNFNAKNTGALIKAMYGGVKFIYQDMESLTDDEKEDLAELWVPFCQKFLQSDYAIILVPMLASASILAPKIRKARQIKIKRKEAEEKKLSSGELHE